MRAPVRGDARQSARHGFHQRHVPTLAAAGGYVAVHRSIKRTKLVVRKFTVDDVGDPTAALLQAKLAQLDRQVDARIAVVYFCDESNIFAAVEHAIECLQQQPRLFALAPFEIRQEHVFAVRIAKPFDRGMEIVAIHAERNYMYWPFQAARLEGLAVE